MGMIKKTTASVVGAAADGKKDFFYCEPLSENVLVDVGRKRISVPESGTGGKGNIISSGSVVAVADGQCALIVEQEKGIDLCLEPGEYIFEAGDSPGKEARIYYCNIKEITGNRYGTPNDVPYRLRDDSIMIDMDVRTRLYGAFSYRIENPALFYQNVCGSITEPYTRAKIDSQLRSELVEALEPAFKITYATGVGYSDLPEHSAELTGALNTALADKWHDIRGLALVEASVAQVVANREDEELITASLAKNASHSVNYNEAFGDTADIDIPQRASEWACSCGNYNAGKFCAECGKPKPVTAPELSESCHGGYYLSDDMRYSHLSVGNNDTRTAMIVVGKTLSSDQKAYPRFRVGNIAFIEIRTSTPNLTDSFSSSKHVCVILGDEPRLVPMPNKELFARFAKIVRADPDTMTPSQRIRAAVILALGNDSDEKPEPTWTDENGVLVIRCHITIRTGMAGSSTTAHTLTVDENQVFTLGRA